MTNYYHLTGQTDRLDKVLTELIPDASRSQIQSWLKEGAILVDNQEQKANYVTKGDETIAFTVPEVKPLTLTPENIDLDIVYQDEDLLVINKPQGMVVHPAKGHQRGTVANALAFYLDQQELSRDETIRPGMVHRIDKDTSGLMVVAKNEQAEKELSRQLQDRTLGRTYLALVHHPFDIQEGIIEVPIARDPKMRTRFAAKQDGKHAVTHFKVLENFKNAALVEASLETGRTHQIRVHMEYIGHPLIGDPVYRKGLADFHSVLTKDQSGQYLHAYRLNLSHPRTGKTLSFEAPLPDKFEALLAHLNSHTV